MKFNYIFLILIYLCCFKLFTSCGKAINCCIIQPPPINVTSERTSLENQIMGTYREIREDVWLVSSSQTVEGLKISTSTNTNIKQEFSVDYKVIKALETIEYDKEIIKEYKTKRYIGENNQGLLEYIENNTMESHPAEKQKLFENKNEVNDARQVLMLEVINKNENLTIDDFDQVKKTFADMYRKQALKNEWIQDSEGKWSGK